MQDDPLSPPSSATLSDQADESMTRTVKSSLQAPVAKALADIGANIQRARQDGFRMSQEVFAKELGFARVTLKRMERGDLGVSAVYYFAALEAIRCLSRVVEVTDPSTLIMSMAPVSWPGQEAAGVPPTKNPLPEGQATPAKPSSKPQVDEAPASVQVKSDAWPDRAGKVTESSAEAPRTTGFGPVLVPPWKAPKP